MKILVLKGNHKVGAYFADLVNNSIYKHKFIIVDETSYVSENEIINLIKLYNIKTIVLAWWPKILKLIPELDIKIINTHPSLLPWGRGKHGYYWCIVNNEPFGITIHEVNKGIDTGPILWQKEIKIFPTDTGEILYNRAVNEMCNLLKEHFSEIAIENFPIAIKQDETKATSHFGKEFNAPELNPKDTCLIGDLINDLRARTFNNKNSGRKIKFDGKFYTIKCYLEEL